MRSFQTLQVNGHQVPKSNRRNFLYNVFMRGPHMGFSFLFTKGIVPIPSTLQAEPDKISPQSHPAAPALRLIFYQGDCPNPLDFAGRARQNLTPIASCGSRTKTYILPRGLSQSPRLHGCCSYFNPK